MRLRRIWFGVGVATVIAGFGLQRAPVALAAAPVPPTISVSPVVAAPGKPVTVVLHMQAVPANFAFPQCAVVDLLSNVILPGDASGGLLAVATVTGAGDFSAVAVVPADTTPGIYTVQARACGIIWASATFQVAMTMPATGAAPNASLVGFGSLLAGAGGLLLLTAWRRPTPQRA